MFEEPVRITFDTSHPFGAMLFDDAVDLDGLGRAEDGAIGQLHFRVEQGELSRLVVRIQNLHEQSARTMVIPFTTETFPQLRSLVYALGMSFSKKALIGIDLDDLVWLLDEANTSQFQFTTCHDFNADNCGDAILQVVCKNLDAIDFMELVGGVESVMPEKANRIVIAVDLPGELTECAFVVYAEKHPNQSELMDIA